ncbi:hypothetical protein FZ934_12375 [Rhizobium grahamii]|uniref:Uncharacterized protein n=1 Tax=Rhizobium grahamii TaxID=1120045 RepID=A0A5Q0C747_9HYPH|nr:MULTISPECIES: hypothetical protein [Rhizobium]QFY61135.1 hypothetical protein FZ934_12375 [Rhizobium grahamii]QRM49712.1 hypothetical protein F3Y33_10515 [Rhizobium sp. BG6]
MSSEFIIDGIDGKSIEMLHGVLAACGYTSQISSRTLQDTPATKLIIKLFRRGVHDHDQLANALHRNFGTSPRGKLLHFTGMNRLAIQGITPQGKDHQGANFQPLI